MCFSHTAIHDVMTMEPGTYKAIVLAAQVEQCTYLFSNVACADVRVGRQFLAGEVFGGAWLLTG